MSDDRAGGAHRARREARHQGSGPTTADRPRPAQQARQRPPNPLASKPPPRPPRRDSLTPTAATSGIWFTRSVVALADLTYGLGFVLDAPTNSSTYHFMESVLPMWAWGAGLIAVAPLLVFGAIAVGAPLGAAIWLWFGYSNAIPLLTADNGAWAVPVFALPAALHLGMWWYILRGRLPRLHFTRADR